jgi:hypothetical protein
MCHMQIHMAVSRLFSYRNVKKDPLHNLFKHEVWTTLTHLATLPRVFGDFDTFMHKLTNSTLDAPKVQNEYQLDAWHTQSATNYEFDI